jgi:hypothetical protein
MLSADGRWSLRIHLRKSGRGGVRRTMLKPVPPAVALCIHSLIEVRKTLEPLAARGEGVEQAVFFSVVESNRLLSQARSESIYPRLETMSEFFDLRTVKGMRWLISPHELRKFFAMSFFHDGERQNSLPALSWLMGHGSDVTKTWHYIRTDLSGQEISSIEATWASVALRTQSEQENVSKLHALLEKHFGTHDLSILDEDEVLEYLEMLRSQGKYTAEPKAIRDSRGQRYNVIIHIQEQGV